MTTDLAILNLEDKIGSTALPFVESLFHAVPIVDQEGNALGLVTSRDVMQ